MKDNIKVHIWLENNKVFFQTAENIKIASFKIQFQNEFSHNPMLQIEHNTIINSSGDKPWTMIPSNNTLFGYSITTQAISSEYNSLLYVFNKI